MIGVVLNKLSVPGDHDKIPPETAGKAARIVAGILYDLKDELKFDLEKVDETVE